MLTWARVEAGIYRCQKGSVIKCNSHFWSFNPFVTSEGYPLSDTTFSRLSARVEAYYFNLNRKART